MNLRLKKKKEKLKKEKQIIAMSSPSTRLQSNLERFLQCVTPVVPSRFLPQVLSLSFHCVLLIFIFSLLPIWSDITFLFSLILLIYCKFRLSFKKEKRNLQISFHYYSVALLLNSNLIFKMIMFPVPTSHHLAALTIVGDGNYCTVMRICDKKWAWYGLFSLLQ